MNTYIINDSCLEIWKCGWNGHISWRTQIVSTWKIPNLNQSVQSLSRVRLFATWWPPCPSPAPRVHPNPCPLNRWCHPTISSSVVPFSCLLSFPSSVSFPRSQFSASGGQSIGVSALASVLPIQDWFPLALTGLISLQFKGLSRVFSNTTVQKHQFFGTQPSLWSNSHVRAWLLEKP